MDTIIEDYLYDARNFQNHGQYELAINTLKQALEIDVEKKYHTTIHKLLCFNYRKMNEFDMALLHINYALENFDLNAKSTIDEQKNYAVCLMNKGVVFEECEDIKKALDCYLPAVNIFKLVYKSVPSENGLLINALLTVGMLFYKLQQYAQTKRYLKSALSLFGEEKENDRRYVAIINTLNAINNE